MQAFQIQFNISTPDGSQPQMKFVRASDWSDVVVTAMKVLQTKDITSIKLLGDLVE